MQNFALAIGSRTTITIDGTYDCLKLIKGDCVVLEERAVIIDLVGAEPSEFDVEVQTLKKEGDRENVAGTAVFHVVAACPAIADPFRVTAS